MNEDTHSYLLCVQNEGYEASLEKRKIYRRLADPKASARALVRVVDESGEDYLFPDAFFVPITVPERATHAFEETTA